MNKEQKRFHKVIKHRIKRRAKRRQPIGPPLPLHPTDTRTPEQKHADDVKLAKELGLGDEQ